MKEKQFKKGKSGNPLGAKLHDPEMRMLKNLTKDEMVEIGSLVLKGSVNQLRAIAKDPNCTALKCMIAAVAVRTISKGDPAALDVLLNRLIGKVKDEVNFTGSTTSVTTILDQKTYREQKKIFDSEY
jgi:hypothetical protein